MKGPRIAWSVEDIDKLLIKVYGDEACDCNRPAGPGLKCIHDKVALLKERHATKSR